MPAHARAQMATSILSPRIPDDSVNRAFADRSVLSASPVIKPSASIQSQGKHRRHQKDDPNQKQHAQQPRIHAASAASAIGGADISQDRIVTDRKQNEQGCRHTPEHKRPFDGPRLEFLATMPAPYSRTRVRPRSPWFVHWNAPQRVKNSRCLCDPLQQSILRGCRGPGLVISSAEILRLPEMR